MPTIRTFAAAVVAGLTASAAPASAAIIFSTADYTGVDTGEYVVQSSRWIGAVFTLSKTTEISGIGGQFGGFPSGQIFGAIVSVSASTGVPDFAPSDIESQSLAHVTFAAPSATTDLTETLDVTLNAGTYAVVFGSGAFGASGWGGLGDGNTTTGSPMFVQSAIWDDNGAWTSQDAGYFDGVRITVSAVPELSTWAMLGLGFAGLALAGGRTLRANRPLA